MRIDFNSSPGASLGVEVEVSLVDRATGALASEASRVLQHIGARHPGGVHPKAKHELFECTVEMVTGICGTPAEAKADLSETLADLQAGAAEHGLAVMCSGTHPFSAWHEQTVSPDPRYHKLVDDLQWPARRLAIYGVHFHVGVRSAEKAIAIANALTGHLPLFLALSASSPYWQGRDTGMASSRVKVFEGLPTAGLPPHLDCWNDFEQLMETLITAQAVATIREVWWDVRPHPDFGTVELRMCDGMPTLREVTALAALAQSLVQHFDEQLDDGRKLAVPREWVVRQNKWLASRYGVDAHLIVDDDGSRAPLRTVLDAVLDRLEPTAGQLGCAPELRDLEAILEAGPSYVRQRAIVAAGGSLRDVVEHLVRELETDRIGA